MKILLVDDSRTIRNIQKNVLAQLGYTDIMEASDGVEALKQIGEIRPDLALIDWNMPNMDGGTRGCPKTPRREETEAQDRERGRAGGKAKPCLCYRGERRRGGGENNKARRGCFAPPGGPLRPGVMPSIF